MADVRVIVDEHEYSEEKFRKDLTRMFDTYRGKDKSDMGNMNCNGVCCDDCPLYKVSCNMKTTNSFKTIGIVYEWALEHPVATNRDKMIETFGGAYFNLIINYISDTSLEDYDNWLNEEYKEPSKQSKEEE